MNTNAPNIILEPVITEKSTVLSQLNKYTFHVSSSATKNHIRSAFESIFPGRKVMSVQTLKIMGHKRRTKSGFKSPVDKRKAIVTASGPRIELFPEAS